MNRMVDDTQCIIEWRQMLKAFELIIKGNKSPEKVKPELDALKEAVKVSTHLTFHQVSAIQARCDNYMSGDYGNTKTAENLTSNYKAESISKDQQNGKH